MSPMYLVWDADAYGDGEDAGDAQEIHATPGAGARAHALESSTRTDSEAIRARWPADVRHMPADRLSEPYLSGLLAHLEAQVRGAA